jgi:hypothetical protein
LAKINTFYSGMLSKWQYNDLRTTSDGV